MKLSEIIRAYRQEHELSLRQFAHMCGLSHAVINNIEREKNSNGDPFTPSFETLQKALRGLRDDEFLFSKEDGKPLTDAWISPALNSFLRYIEAKTGKEMEFTCHDLRDTFATMCYDAGVDVQTTAKWMGHSNVMTTLKIYTKLSAEKHEESVERMNDFVSEVI